MNNFVLDCSVTMAWLFEDEARPDTDALLTSLSNGKAIVPNIWQLEVCNVLLQAEKRGRISKSQIVGRLELLHQLPIETDTETSNRAFREILLHAQSHGLTSYDAAYIELAIRLNLPIATLDKALKRAAVEAKLEILPT